MFSGVYLFKKPLLCGCVLSLGLVFHSFNQAWAFKEDATEDTKQKDKTDSKKIDEKDRKKDKKSDVKQPEPTAAEILKEYDRIMGPQNFEAMSQMTAHREDGTSRTYKMKVIKSGDDKLRIWFKEPSSVAGQEMLRRGDDSWLYMPNLKRSTRVANRDSFQGGDFNNADVMRVNYTADYTGTLKPSDDPEAYHLSLKSKTPDSSYDRIELWVQKKDYMPIKGEFYGASGNILRSAVYTDYKNYSENYRHPAKISMRNELIKARYSEMMFDSMDVNVEFPAQKFTQTELGK